MICRLFQVVPARCVAKCDIQHLILHAFHISAIGILYPYLCHFTDLVLNFPLRLVCFDMGGDLLNLHHDHFLGIDCVLPWFVTIVTYDGCHLT